MWGSVYLILGCSSGFGFVLQLLFPDLGLASNVFLFRLLLLPKSFRILFSSI